MNKRIAFFPLVTAVVFLGVHTETRVTVGGADVRVERAADDGLEELASQTLVVGPELALASCAPWDIRDNCCPAGCAAKKTNQWPKADNILRGCMRGLGCTEDQTKSATVFIKCDCPK